MFGFTSFILTIVYTVSAVAIWTLALATEDDVTKFCNHELATNDLEGFTTVAIKDINLFIDDIDSGIQSSVETYMCKEHCPCVLTDFDRWSPQQKEDFTDEDGEYRFDGDVATFTDCYMELQEKAETDESIDLNTINENVLGVVQALEVTYQCSGLCSVPTFWTSKSI